VTGDTTGSAYRDTAPSLNFVYLAASPVRIELTTQATNNGIAAAVPLLQLRVPAVLRREADIEINASTEVRSLAIKLYHSRSQHHGSLLSVRK
jgi:hypothetical protein